MPNSTSRKPRVVVFGEALVDLFSSAPGIPLETTSTLVPRLGGAPANVAVHLARQKHPVTLLSAVGDGPFGRRVRRALEDEGVDVSQVHIKAGLRTGITLVALAEDGERQFTAHRKGAADLAITPNDLDKNVLGRATMVHGGTVTLSTEAGRQATAAVREWSPQALQSLDVNLRFGMFERREDLLRVARAEVKKCHVVKLAREEAEVLFGEPTASVDALIDAVLAQGPTLVLLTLDVDGAVLANASVRVRVKSQRVQVVDATGAGDAFVGAALARLPHSASECASLSEAALGEIGRAACAAGAHACSVVGACGPPSTANDVA